MSALVEPRLVLLALRRALHPGLALPLAALALVLSLGGGSEEAFLGELSAQAVRGLARQGVWVGSLLFLVPALLLHAARGVPSWRRRDAAWLAPRRLGPSAALASSWLGTALGGALAVAFVALAGELVARGSDPTWRAAAQLAAQEERPLPDGAGWTWRSADPGPAAPAGSRVRVLVDLGLMPASGELPAGPGAEVRLTVRRARPGPAPSAAEVKARFARAAELELELPPGPGALEFELARAGEGASLAPSGGATLLTPSGGERGAALALALRVAWALAAGLALALGLGAWMSAPTAAILTALVAAVPRVGPAAGLGAGFDALGRGLAPPGPSAASLAGAAAFVLVGLALARAGQRAESGG